jgi:acyl transferase domain-containing protein
MSESDVFTGAMLAVALPAAPLEAYLERVCPGDSAWPDKLVIGCVNSPTNTTVSGNLRYIQLLQEMLDAEGIFNRRLRVPVAYHSPQMAKIVSECCNHFSPLESSVPTSQINMVSTVTGSLLSRETAVQGAYWIENILSPVLFSSAIQSVCRGHDLDSHGPRKKLDRSHHTFLGANLLIEIGPHAALRLPVLETVNEMSSKVAIRYFSALHRKQPASTSLLRLLGELQSLGMAVNLRKANQPYLPHEEVPMSLVDAPKYPFDHANKYWSESHVIRNYRQRNHGYVELLGTPIKEWNPLEPQWRCCVDIADMPWLLEHQLNGRAVYPASAFLVMAIQGACQLVKTGTEIVAFTLCDVRFESAIPVSIDERELETRLRFRKPRSGSSRTETCWEFSVFSVTAGNWNESCVGTIQLHHQPGIPSEGLEEQPGTLCDLFETRSRASHYYYHKTEVYGNFAKHGFLYGSVFQGIDEIRHDGQDSAIGRLSRSIPSGSGDIKDYSVIHPATLDSFLQTALTALSRGDRTIPTQAVSSIKRIWISAEGLQPGSGHIWTSARLESQKLMNKVYSAFGLCEDQKHVRIELDELETTVVSLPEEDTLPLALYSQHLYEFHTCVDIAVLSGAEVVDLLKSVCGPDTLGPGIFYHNLRQFLHKRTQKILQELSTDDLDKTKPYLKRYWEWLHWQTSQHESLISEASNSLLRTCLESQGFLGEFFLRFSDVVLEVLRGRCDIVGLLFEDNLVASFYEQQLSGSLFYRKLQVYLDFYSFKNPGLEVLEIGAGTGSFTEHILDAFSSSAIRPEARCKSYMYTDVSPAFFEKAREKFDKYTHQMAFAVLDIEQDPVSQGFVERGFDVVSASNVLHVTKDLDTTLQNIRRLLKKGGKLILHEYIVPEDIEVGFVFGLLPGWWPSSEEARKMSPLCTERSWDELLRKNGFSGAEIIIPDFCDSESHRMSIMIATATDAGSDPHLLDVTFVVESHSTTQLELANCLASLFSADGFRPTNILDISDTVSCPATTGLIVTLFDWETPLLSRMNEGIFETLKSLLASTRSILWVSGGGQATSLPDHGLVDGFARVYRQENISARFATLRLDGNTTEEQEKWIVCAAKELLKASEPAHPEDYIMEDGMLCLRRICESPQLMQKLLDTNSGIAQIAGTGGSADTLPVRYSSYLA